MSFTQTLLDLLFHLLFMIYLEHFWKQFAHNSHFQFNRISSVQFSSVTQSCPTVCDPMDYSTVGLPVHHQLLEFTQTHVHWVSDAIQSSHLLSSPSPPAFNFSQHQGLFKSISSLQQVAKVLEFQLQHQSFQYIFRTDSFSMDWLDLLAVEGTLKSLLQHHSSKASYSMWSFGISFSHLMSCFRGSSMW